MPENQNGQVAHRSSLAVCVECWVFGPESLWGGGVAFFVSGNSMPPGRLRAVFQLRSLLFCHVFGLLVVGCSSCLFGLPGPRTHGDRRGRERVWRPRLLLCALCGFAFSVFSCLFVYPCWRRDADKKTAYGRTWFVPTEGVAESRSRCLRCVASFGWLFDCVSLRALATLDRVAVLVSVCCVFGLGGRCAVAGFSGVCKVPHQRIELKACCTLRFWLVAVFLAWRGHAGEEAS